MSEGADNAVQHPGSGVYYLLGQLKDTGGNMAIFEIKCDKCGTTHSYDCSHLNWECVSSDERHMGPENQHNATIVDTCSCGQGISVTFSCWEYPVGAENTSDIAVSGATIVKNECASCPGFN